MYLKKYIQIILNYKTMIIIITLFSILSAIVGYLISPPSYSASTTVYLKPEAAKILVDKGQTKNLTEVASIGQQYISQTYKELLNSRFLRESTVRILNLDKPKEPTGFRKKIQDILKPVKEPIDKTVYYILYGMYNPDPFEKAVKKLGKSVKVEQNMKTYLYTITAQDKDSKVAADISNTIATEFVKYCRDVNSSEARTYREFLEGRINILHAELEHARENLKNFKDKYGISDLKEQTKSDINSLSSFEKTFDEVNAQIREMKTVQQEVATDKDARKDNDTTKSTTEKENSLLDQLRKDLAKSEVELSSLKEKYTDSNKKVIELKAEIAATKDRINKQVEEIMNSLNAKKMSLEAVVKKYESAIRLNPMKEKTLKELELAVEVTENTYKKIQDQYEDARLEENKKINEIRVFDRAKPPLYPKWPWQILYPLLGFINGLIVSIGLAFFIEYMDDTIKSIEHAEKVLGYSVLTTIPNFQNRK